jgi:8-oxo-dGTP pyrophosphatase MutT (NUDIX family)
MVRRSARSAFAPDAFVFPGGTVDASDASAEMRARSVGLSSGPLRDEFRAAVPDELPSSQAPVDATVAASLKVAALRELFEEAGVLLACTAGGEAVTAQALSTHGTDVARAAVAAGTTTFAEFLEARGWFADGGALVLFSHWITPVSEPRRYNTHFFLADAPADQAAAADAGETHDGIWIAPAEALQRNRDGSFHLVYPTIKHLERLAAFSTLDDARSFARTKPVLTIEPTCAPHEGFVMPAALENAW